VRAAARVPEHPNVIATLDRMSDRGADFLVMEYVEGPNLGDYIVRNHPFTIHRVVEILLECARGLNHLHEQRIIHRDIKPENYVVGETKSIKLIDLGLARFDQAPSSFSRGEQLTVEGSTLGTPSYMSPEQIRDPRKADRRSDVYSLGCVLYNLLTGQRPYARINPMETLEAQLLEPTPPLRPARSDVPEALEKLYLRMMAKDPDERPQQVADVITELERILAEAPTTRAKGTSVAPAGPKVSGVGLAVLAGGGLIVLLLILWLAGVLG
jgi:serine/threonine protein kinase